MKGDILNTTRKNGILLHISSLPSPYGIGTMGKDAYAFIDFLEKSGQSIWQILPICPTSYGDSPYQSFSTFAGNPYFIDLDMLAAMDLLETADYQTLDWGNDPASIDYALLYAQRFPVLRKAVSRLWHNHLQEVSLFCMEQAGWLHDYALFMALKDENNGASWFTWEDGLRLRHNDALHYAKERLALEISFWEGLQYLFFLQWAQLKQYANAHGVSILGDVPIYVAGDSVDVWANPHLFQLDDNLQPTHVAGCPPDGFSADGQLWGNPLFRWDVMAHDGYAWWVNRIAYQCRTYDLLRIDHFRGFEAYYAIPFGDTTARRGQWRKGPGIALFQAVEHAIGKQNIIAEDLGFLTEDVYRMLHESTFPGMKVLQFGFDSRDGESSGDSTYLPHNYPKHCVAYVGTHDNDTFRGWLHTAPAADVALARTYLRLNEQEGETVGAMRALWMSAADTTIVQMQDLLDLDSFARTNTPSVLGGNWQWRTLQGTYDDKLALWLAQEMQVYSR